MLLLSIIGGCYKEDASTCCCLALQAAVTQRMPVHAVA